MRKLANKGFTPRLIRAMEPRVQTITQDLLKPLTGHVEVDLVSALSVPLPIIVIAEMLGIEVERQADFKRRSDDVVRSLNRPTDETVRAEIRQSITEFRTYLGNMIERRRTEPGDDLITALVQAEEERQVLSSIEILGLTVLLLAAGNETTTNLIGNAVLALLGHMGQVDLFLHGLERTEKVQQLCRHTLYRFVVVFVCRAHLFPRVLCLCCQFPSATQPRGGIP